MARRATWKPHEAHGELGSRRTRDLPDDVFAFPGQRKEPLTDARHVRNAVARFDQVTNVIDTDRDLAWLNIRKAATHYGIDLAEAGWGELGSRPHTANPAHS